MLYGILTFQLGLLRFQIYPWIWPSHLKRVFIICILFLCFASFTSSPSLTLDSTFASWFLRWLICMVSIVWPHLCCQACNAGFLPFVLSSHLLLPKSHFFYRTFLIPLYPMIQMVPKVPGRIFQLLMEQSVYILGHNKRLLKVYEE